MEALGVIFVVSTTLLIYFLPSIIASVRNHRNTAAILGLNVVGGWTVLGWIIAFVWALTANVKTQAEMNAQSARYKDEGPLE